MDLFSFPMQRGRLSLQVFRLIPRAIMLSIKMGLLMDWRLTDIRDFLISWLRDGLSQRSGLSRL
ncbi:hypothetical protein PT85_01555 [Pseudomonas flexibilis]|uniref:Uncharacterized protein n=1 Tax=Pseudomonas flexibilis TaxID=706570 RepID=A0A0B3C012_9PSED|nr:hypothetical protein PT85_01555 [Pseudomonas flexibilis]